jgi:cytochrome b561
MTGWKNEHNVYGWLSVILHWISAAGVIWLYFLGENIEHAKEDRLPREQVRALIDFHASIGAIFFVFLLARILNHYAQKQPAKPAQNRYLNLLATAVMQLFLLMIAIQIVTGPLVIWTRPEAIEVFNWISIPSPFAARNEWLHETAEEIHALAPNLFWPLIALHVAGALKHLFLDKARTSLRMFGMKR